MRQQRKYSKSTVLGTPTYTCLAHADAILRGKIAITTYANTLPAAEKEVLLKLEVLYNSKDPDIAIDPYQVDNGIWKDDIMLWPSVEFGEINTYLTDTPEPFKREKMKTYKSLKAFNY